MSHVLSSQLKDGVDPAYHSGCLLVIRQPPACVTSCRLLESSGVQPQITFPPVVMLAGCRSAGPT